MKKEYYELLEKMMSFYEQFAAQHGTSPQVQVNLAYYHLKFGNLLLVGGERTKAAEHYRRALGLQAQVVSDCPGVAAHEDRLAYVHFHLADLLTQTGQPEEAAEHYDRGFRIVEKLVLGGAREQTEGRGPVLAGYYRCLAWNRATCLGPRFRDPVRAVEAGQKAAQLEPGAVIAWTCVGIAHYRAGDWEAALAALDKAMRRGGGNSTDWLFLAMAHWQRGEKVQARRSYDRAIQRKPDGPPGYPVRYDGFRAEAAALLGIDIDQEAQDNTKAPAKH